MLAYGVATPSRTRGASRSSSGAGPGAAIPSLIRPGVSVWWAMIVVAAACVWLVWFRPAAPVRRENAFG
jgi:hypothetical protein